LKDHHLSFRSPSIFIIFKKNSETYDLPAVFDNEKGMRKRPSITGRNQTRYGRKYIIWNLCKIIKKEKVSS